MEETERTCPYCGTKFPSKLWNKKFCCYEHSTRYSQLVHLSNTRSITDPNERRIWEEVH